MIPEVSGMYIFLTTTKKIWEAVRQTYSKVQDVALIYEIKTKISATKQELNVEFDQVRVQILEKETLPFINEVFLII